MKQAITNVRVFDGEAVSAATSVLFEGDRILSVGGLVPPDAEVIDASGATLLPGLIDAHAHTDEAALALALRFGVTTELEMQGLNTRNDRAHITHNDALADVRSAGFGLTPPGGHPSELFPKDFEPARRAGGERRPRVSPIVRSDASSPEEAVAIIPKLIAAGSDYIKFMVDDGSIEGHPDLPTLDQSTLTAGVWTQRSI